MARRRSSPAPRDGYGFVLPAGRPWPTEPDEEWEIEMMVPSELAGAVHRGCRLLDGAFCRVFRLADGRHLGQSISYSN